MFCNHLLDAPNHTALTAPDHSPYHAVILAPHLTRETVPLLRSPSISSLSSEPHFLSQLHSMESRVLSRATAFSASASLRRLPRDSPNASFLSVKPIGAVSDGGHLVCGRQLRPELCSPALRKEALLKPCLAAASSPAEGSDSGG